MIIHKGYITEATEDELWKYYLKHEFDDVMPFDNFLELMRGRNVHIIKDESEGEMSLDKAINSGKEHRKPYRKSKRCDKTCRNHGSCPYCQGNRKHSTDVRKMKGMEDE